MRPTTTGVLATAIGLVAAASVLIPAGDDRQPYLPASATPARRIVSLIPAATEILFAIGAGDRLVGRTRWGIHPPEARGIPDVGDGVRPALEAVLARNPDLVVLFAGSDTEGARTRLDALRVPTLSLKHNTIEDLGRNVALLGEAVGCPLAAQRLIHQIREDVAAVSRATAGLHPIRVYYDVWPDPPMTVGRGSFLDSLISIAGGVNVFGDLSASAPQISLETVVHRDPDLIVHPVADAPGSRAIPPGDRPGWGSVRAVARGAVVRVDADLLGRLGPRLGDAAIELARALRPEARLPAPRGAVFQESCTG